MSAHQVCPTGKLCFRTPAEAEPYREALAADEHPKKAERLHSYHCKRCGWFHNGHDGMFPHPRRRGKHRRRPQPHA
jgi:hypothetical protein